MCKYKKFQPYLHQYRLTEFLSVDNLYGDFLACDTVDSEFDQPCETNSTSARQNLGTGPYV